MEQKEFACILDLFSQLNSTIFGTILSDSQNDFGDLM